MFIVAWLLGAVSGWNRGAKSTEAKVEHRTGHSIDQLEKAKATVDKMIAEKQLLSQPK